MHLACLKPVSLHPLMEEIDEPPLFASQCYCGFVGHNCCSVTYFCNEVHIFLQSSTAVFLAALPTPPLLKITGRVRQDIQFKSLISCFRLI